MISDRLKRRAYSAEDTQWEWFFFGLFAFITVVTTQCGDDSALRDRIMDGPVPKASDYSHNVTYPKYLTGSGFCLQSSGASTTILWQMGGQHCGRHSP
jgi:hypothetical protein